MFIIQAMTMNGAIIEVARWRPSSGASFMGVGHQVSVNLKTSDKALLSYVHKQNGRGCYVDAEGPESYVVVSCKVKSIKHMLHNNSITSMIQIVPVNRLAERMLVYIMSPELCDPGFAASIRSG